MLEKLLDAVRDTCVFLGAECLGCEVVAARFKASFDETRVKLEEVLHLLLLDDAGHGLLFSR